MTAETDRKIPNPVYAAAGVGDLAYQQLRKLPGKVNELRGRVTDIRAKAQDEDTNVVRVDVDKLREAAKRNAAVLRSGALAAQDRASALYADLVARGQQVVRASRTAGSDQVERVAELTSDAAVAIAPEPEPAAPAEPVAPEAVSPADEIKGDTPNKPKKSAPRK
jgi:heparin binding hemagglutinin HbhA